ncbi:histidine phosphatase family protein [Oceanobacillus profundus]|uniref:histidine phosphatase family protein n=1 Tax=Oceanobacillus TaxID=182709 RepID=UPI0026E27697|nr:histidine phosphatase family protein [Oceanobacillus profundus]MDO6447916.1 histidine phosphatase family protein [Oceanobacillus profundus]
MLFLVRHGETEWNLHKRLQGQQDIPLSEVGVNQARELGLHFQNQHIVFEHVYTSDLLRAHQTAQLITKGMSISKFTIEPNLRERFYGELEGEYIDDIVKLMPDYDKNFGVKMQYGIESLEDMQKRMVSILTSIAKVTEGSPTLIVSHGGSINALLHYITKGEMGTGKGKLANTSFTRLQWSNQTFHVQAYNETSRLKVT